MLVVWSQQYGKIKINRHLLHVLKLVKMNSDTSLETAIPKATSFIEAKLL